MTVAITVATTACDKLGWEWKSERADRSAATPDAPVVYAVLGASDAQGIGSSVPCLPVRRLP